MIRMLLALLVSVLMSPALTGTVQSVDHRPIASAIVVAEQNGRTFVAPVDASGAFTLADVTLPATVEVHAPGYMTIRQVVETSPVAFTLTPSRIRESIIVTASTLDELWRRPTTGTTVLSAETIENLPIVTIDEAIRVVAGVSLFRRSASRASNPTTHGVTMRGLSASGASRGLVMFDGIPLNDGFGGWVTWTRVPAFAPAQVTVDRGAEGATFGSDALGGVIEMTTRSGVRSDTAVGASAGSEGVASVDASAGGRKDRFAFFGAASWFRTDGVIPVAPESRGAVDTPADAEWSNALGKVSFGERSHRLTLGAWGGSDDRGNGTVVQRNRMSGGTGSIAYDGLVRSTNLAARVSVSPNDLTQTFSFPGAGRNIETLTSTQTIDTRTTRGIFEAGRPIPRGYVTARAAFTRGTADFADERPSGTSITALRDDGGAVSVHAGWSPALPVSVGAGVRREWRAAGKDQRDAATVGHVSAAWQVSDAVVLRGSVATSHRWPTLNELARNFQVGAVLTVANLDLLPERARSVDAALTFARPRWSVSVAGYRTIVDDAIANVTIQSTPSIVRQRRNAGNADARGLELDAEIRPWSFARVRASAVLVDARFRDSLEPPLEGKRLPQVPRGSVSLSGDVRVRTWLQAAVIYRWLSPQFDDDRNVFKLARASQADIRVFGSLRSFTWHVTLENAGDSRVEVGRTPIVTLAPGRAVRVGLTWRR